MPTTLNLDCTLQNLNEFVEYLRSLDITFKILTWNGAAGGNAEVEFYGSSESIETLLNAYRGGHI